MSFFDFNLPEELIAQTPLPNRDDSRLLSLDPVSGNIQHLHFKDVLQVLMPTDTLILNETRVTARRLLGNRETGGATEFLLLKQLTHSITPPYAEYEALSKPSKALKVGATTYFGNRLQGQVLTDIGEGKKVVRINLLVPGNYEELQQELDRFSVAPLPPYIKTSLSEKERYQTTYSRKDLDNSMGGSAAAPTAGLHFTPELLDSISKMGVNIGKVNLQVGLDTFRPITSENISEHKMHGEVCTIPDETRELIRKSTGRIIAVGTTSARTLETFARLPNADYDRNGKRFIPAGEVVSRLFLAPESPITSSREMKVVDGMFTNFHMPKTTMLLMISVLAGERNISRAYLEAVEKRYRFLSFGDSMFIGHKNT